MVRERQLFPLCRQDIPTIPIPSEFFVLFELSTSEEEIIAGLADRACSEVEQRTYSQARNALRNEEERPCGLRTYRPFRGQLQDAKPAFMELLRIAGVIIDKIEVPCLQKPGEGPGRTGFQ